MAQYRRDAFYRGVRSRGWHLPSRGCASVYASARTKVIRVIHDVLPSQGAGHAALKDVMTLPIDWPMTFSDVVDPR